VPIGHRLNVTACIVSDHVHPFMAIHSSIYEIFFILLPLRTS